MTTDVTMDPSPRSPRRAISNGKKSDKKTPPAKRNSKKDQKDGKYECKRRMKTKKIGLEGGNSSGETCFDGWSEESQSGDSDKMDTTFREPRYVQRLLRA